MRLFYRFLFEDQRDIYIYNYIFVCVVVRVFRRARTIRVQKYDNMTYIFVKSFKKNNKTKPPPQKKPPHRSILLLFRRLAMWYHMQSSSVESEQNLC